MDADNHDEERIAFHDMDSHIMKMVIIYHPVIYPFAGSVVFVNSLLFLGFSWDRSIETDMSVWFCVDAAAIGGWGAFLLV